MEQKIKQSGLGYNRCKGCYKEKQPDGSEVLSEENSFIIYNTKYNDFDFKKLMISFGELFDQDSILITYPIEKKDRKTFANIMGELISTSTRVAPIGTVLSKFENASSLDIKENFTRIYGRSYSLQSIASIVEPQGPISNGYVKEFMKKEFKRLYPDLSD